MAIQEILKLQITPFWDSEYKSLNYKFEPFNDEQSLIKWRSQGYCGTFTGVMCDMRNSQPSWNNKVIDFFSEMGWKDIGTSYYRMDTGTILPTHQDLYIRYVKLFNLQEKLSTIYRAIVFLEDWQSGHYAEYNYKPFVNWNAGACIIWNYDTPHMAANLGPTSRYTLQVTGHL